MMRNQQGIRKAEIIKLDKNERRVPERLKVKGIVSFKTLKNIFKDIVYYDLERPNKK